MSATLLHIHGRLLDLSKPRVMAILNVTEDSFYTHCPSCTEADVLAAASQQLSAGADILDIGACSTRPGSAPVAEQVEHDRIVLAVKAVRSAFPDALLSVDTFRASVAQAALEAGADLIDDVSGGNEAMYDLVSQAHVPYVLTHAEGTTMDECVDFFARRLDMLHRRGVADVVVDPGLGFGKTTEQDWERLRHLNDLRVLQTPVLVGVSRKSMIYKALGTDADHALYGTIAAHVYALEGGASILRVHDVAAAKDAIKIFDYVNNN